MAVISAAIPNATISSKRLPCGTHWITVTIEDGKRWWETYRTAIRALSDNKIEWGIDWKTKRKLGVSVAAGVVTK